MRKLVVAWVGVVSLTLVLATPIGAGSGPHISVTPTQGGPGTPLHVEGNCGVPGPHTVFIGFVIDDEVGQGDVTLAETTSGSDGSFSVDVEAPQIAPPLIVPGQGAIVALCDYPGSNTISTPFTLLDDALGQEPSSTTTTAPDVEAPATTRAPAPAPLRVSPSFTG